MSFSIIATPHFARELKRLAKRHRSMKEDFKTFKESLEDNPLQGVDLGGGLRKIRMTIASKGRGKSGGARVITYNIITKEDEGRVYLVEVYDKADFSTVDLAIVREMVDGLGL